MDTSSHLKEKNTGFSFVFEKNIIVARSINFNISIFQYLGSNYCSVF